MKLLCIIVVRINAYLCVVNCFYKFGCRLVTKTYRLINIKSTTPEELYAHKVCKWFLFVIY